MKQNASQKRVGKVPLTILTGYLGAGKTTLLQRLLHHAQKSGLKLAVLMNEFGEIGIDTKTIKAGRNVDVVEMAGGCVCCSMTGEFEAAVREVIGKFHPEHIVLEATGVAEPDAIAFDVREALPQVRLDAIITIVDADALVRFPSLGRTGRTQIEMADIILLNKKDLVDAPGMQDARKAVGEINARAAIIPTVRCDADPQMLLGVNAEEKKTAKNEAHESEKTGSFVFKAEKPMDETKAAAILEKLPSGIYRAKGFVTVGDGKGVKTLLYNFVAGRAEFEPFAKEGKTALVFIGEGINSKVQIDLEKKLRLCLK
ncbi:GTP-binding protein [Candidatus Micrarchaeota archaeon]|nr:GTP-binding protein [Candidatus Micrarchaeota archaeon]MBI5176689.1 GTP-binding protein [Candidatus Micrarchaeota archaeon]